ncbi:DUF3179 domain-containing protein [Melioribacteraceae bacterium 4301-Me]|uniref:DUF3179 domain-containing protein n=1 Tax=Pyranulibacter aquaticus TaxID=3163344 RepID=UPI003597B626
MLNKLIYSVMFILYFTSCDKLTDFRSSGNDVPSGNWLIPTNEIYDGGPGKDGIPALVNPELISDKSATYLNDEDLVIAIKINNELRVYPHKILDWHEIINDGINSVKYAITYCPLTGSGIAYNREINNLETTFGVSGLLYNTNLIAYDRATNSNWSQMKLECVNGKLIGKLVQTFPIIETYWKTIKNYFTDSKVVSLNTGYSRNYGVYPYGDYKTNNSLLLFPVSHEDSRLPRKERVLGVLINNKAKAFKFTDNTENSISIKQSTLNNVNFVVVDSKKNNFIVAYQPVLNNGKSVTLKSTNSNLPVIMEDQFNNKYDLFGYVIEGLDEGAKLKTVTQYIAYWFAWAAFYPDTELE